MEKAVHVFDMSSTGKVIGGQGRVFGILWIEKRGRLDMGRGGSNFEKREPSDEHLGTRRVFGNENVGIVMWKGESE